MKLLTKRCVNCSILLMAAHAGAEQYVFPKNGQSAEQQKRDESLCHDWAARETGTDPLAAQKKMTEAANLANTSEQPVKTGPDRGVGVSGAVVGAGAGALIAEIGDDDRSEAAAQGAAIGAIAARGQSRRANRRAAQQQEQAAAEAKAKSEEIQAQTQKGLAEFYKARGVCLEAKGYSVSS